MAGLLPAHIVPTPLRALAFAAWLAATAAFGFTTDSANQTLVTDGSQADVQAAINAASDGWTVVIPAGTYAWSSSVTISGKGIHLRGDGGVNITGGASPKIWLTKDASHVVQVSGLNISGGAQGIYVSGSWSAKPFIVRDCGFTVNGQQAMRVECNGGLIYNCWFLGAKQYNDEAIQHKNDYDPDGSWSTADTMGMKDVNGDKNLYVEDCAFTNMIYQSFDFDGSSRIVIRNSTFNDTATTSHGADTGPIGMRHAELYRNRFIFNNFGDCDGSKTAPLDYFVFIRGGTGCIFSNNFDNLQSCAWGSKGEIKFQIQNIRRGPTQIACQTSYPAYRQIGIGHNGTGYITDPFYIWGHATYVNVANAQYEPDQCGNGQLQSNYLVDGRDYFSNTARPNYTPYTYPHPLRSGGGGATNPPAILTAPASATVNQGANVTFSVVASGSGTLAYQWQRNGANLAGATGASYALTSVQTNAAGSYRCVVTNAFGSVTSAAATLTVNVPLPVAPGITAQPQSITRVPGQSATFSVTATGDAPLAYQWQKNGANLAGATAANYSILSVVSGDAGNFRCVITNAAGVITSAVATLTVDAAAPGNVRYVDFTAGNDANPGTLTAPWKRCPGMVGWTGSATLQAGDTVYFDRADVWDIGANASGPGLDLRGGVRYIGDSYDPQGVGAGLAELRASGRHEAGVVRFWQDHATYPTSIEGFEINANGFRANLVDINHAFWTTGLTKGVKRVANCVAFNNTGNGSEGDYKYGIIVSDHSGDASGWVANVEILNTKVYSVARDGICLYPGESGMISNIVVRGCEVLTTGLDPSYSEGHGIIIKGNVKNSVVEYNYSHDVNSSAVFINGPETGTGPGPSGCAVRYNILQTADNNGVIRFYGTGAKSVDIYGNLILPNNVTGGLSFAGNSGTVAARIYNNTFYDAYVEIGNPSSTGTIEFRNNIIYEVSNTPLVDSGAKITAHANNLFYRESGGTTLVTFGGSSYTSATLASFEPTASAANPLFKNPANLPNGWAGSSGSTLAPNNDGLSLQAGSPAVTLGANLGAPFNSSINSAARPASGGWQLGAYQGSSTNVTGLLPWNSNLRGTNVP